MGSGFQMTAPAGAVQLQMGAYQQYAPQPSFDGVNDVPRLGTYLLRMVVDDAVELPALPGLARGRPVGRERRARLPGTLRVPAAGALARRAGGAPPATGRASSATSCSSTGGSRRARQPLRRPRAVLLGVLRARPSRW